MNWEENFWWLTKKCTNYDGTFECSCGDGWVETVEKFEPEANSACAEKIYVSYSGEINIQNGIIGEFLIQEGLINGKPYWKHGEFESFIFAATSVSHHNWHIYDKLGNNWGWLYTTPSDCPHESSGNRKYFLKFAKNYDSLCR